MHQRFRRNRQHDHRGDRERPKGDRAAVDHDGDQHPPPLAPRNVLIYIGYLNGKHPRSPNYPQTMRSPTGRGDWTFRDCHKAGFTSRQGWVSETKGIQPASMTVDRDRQPRYRLRNDANRRSLPDGHPCDSGDPNAMVDGSRRVNLVLHEFRKAKQHDAAVRLAAGERGCPIGDARRFARAI